jgi:pyruvate dehydrogenase E1 component
VVAASDFIKAVPDMIGRFVNRRFVPLGTDGFGRSDTREELRRFFEVDAAHIALAVLSALFDEGKLPAATVRQAIADLKLDPDAPEPSTSEVRPGAVKA